MTYYPLKNWLYYNTRISLDFPKFLDSHQDFRYQTTSIPLSGKPSKQIEKFPLSDFPTIIYLAV